MPSQPSKIAAVIPVYNHAATLRAVAERTLAVHPAVIVVDDGSRDGGAETLAGLPIHSVRHPVNLGKGAAILAGARKARELGMSHIVTLDADGQHDPEEIPRFVTEVQNHPGALVVGKRDFHGRVAPASSRVGRRISNFWFFVETGRCIGDAQSGFRAYPIRLLEALRLRERRYTFEIEVLVKAAWSGTPIRQVDVSTHYSAPGERVSHFHLFRDNVRLSFLNASLLLQALAPPRYRRFRNLYHDESGRARRP
jgi:glycosyltransferase involved in cell wall biosynthesis